MTPIEDPLWPRAIHLFNEITTSLFDSPVDIALLGIPASQTSISPTEANKTPDAIRAALSSYSTFHGATGRDLRDLKIIDSGDIKEPDGQAGEGRTIAKISELRNYINLLIALGGDNSITFAVAQGSQSQGLITLDAHHDLRDGINNGSPVRRLIDAGLSGKRVVQIGIADFSNSKEYAARAKDYGITVFSRDLLRRRPIIDVMAEALVISGENTHVDFDADVCDRSVVPACPAAAPGGISADEFRQIAFIAGAAKNVNSIDITEIDVSADAPDQRTVRLAALSILEMCAGYGSR